MIRLLIFIGCLALSGCISHRAHVTPPTDAPCSAAVGTHVVDDFATPISETGSLPRSIPVTAWRKDDQGHLFRGDAVVETPRPWWQRFPADAVSDMVIPYTMTAEASGSVTLLPVPASSSADLADHARSAGYAAPAVETPHP